MIVETFIQQELVDTSVGEMGLLLRGALRMKPSLLKSFVCVVVWLCVFLSMLLLRHCTDLHSGFSYPMGECERVCVHQQDSFSISVESIHTGGFYHPSAKIVQRYSSFSFPVCLARKFLLASPVDMIFPSTVPV